MEKKQKKEKKVIIKFYYDEGAKKVKLKKNKLTWDNICDILMSAF
jgi:hypothetical protein